MDLINPTKWLDTVMFEGLMSLRPGSKIICHITSPTEQLEKIKDPLDLSKILVTSLTKQLGQSYDFLV